MTFLAASAGVVRRAVLLLLPLGTGWIGFALTFSDRSPGETIVQRTATILLTQMLGGAAVGFLAPRRWYASLAAAWGSLFWVALRPSLAFERPKGRFPEDVIHPSWVPLVAVLLTLALGYAGSRLRKWVSPP